MSVPKYRRTGSQLDCYDKAQAMRISALKDLLNSMDATRCSCRNPSEEKILLRLAENLQDDLHSLVCNILHANAINPQYEWEVNERRKFQDFALGDCMSLQNDFLTLATLFRGSLHCLLHYATDTQETEKMIRSWRKYNNEILKRIKNKESVYSHNPGNFCNVNGNGNSNNNNANNTNGVRPD